MNIVYLQCNMQLNNHLLHPYGDTTVIGAVVKKFEPGTILVADIYDCVENKKLVSYLRSLGVKVRVSPISNITHRLINFCETLKSDSYIIRIFGSQVLLNMEYFNIILEKMVAQNCDYFYYKYNDGQVPEVVKASVILQNKETVKKVSRYYQAFEQIQYNTIPNLKALKFTYPAMPIRIHAADKAMIAILERYSSDMTQLIEKVKDVVYKMGSASYLTLSGYLSSLIENELYDSEKNPIPWYTYPMITLLKDRLKKNMNVFEFGCGFSTLFYSKKVQSVTSIENDYGWYQNISALELGNVKIQYIELEYGGEYSKAILKYHEAFDVVCIDGRDRCNCAKNCISALKKSGVIIFDDTDREQYREAYQFLKDAGFTRLDLKGLTPTLYGDNKSTSVFYRADNCLGL